MTHHSAAILLFSATPFVTSTTPSNLVVPANSGTFTVSALLPRTAVLSERTGCPWDQPGLVPFPSVNDVNITLLTSTRYLLSTDVTLNGTLTVPYGAELIFADTSFELTARSIRIQDGKLTVGSPTCRTSASTRHTITLVGSRSDPDSGLVGHKGIVVSGSVASIDIFAALSHSPRGLDWRRRLRPVRTSCTCRNALSGPPVLRLSSRPPTSSTGGGTTRTNKSRSRRWCVRLSTTSKTE